MARGGPRPGSGRRRKAPELKALAGTDRADREVQPLPGADPSTAPMIAPLHLSEHAQLLFAGIAGILEGQKRASPDYAMHVALLAQRLEQIQRFQAVLETMGDTHTSRSTRKVDGEQVVFEMVRARPEVAMLSDAMRHAQSLIGELMLNPSAALRIASGHKPEENPFGDF